jgi:uncharacterized membrane protein YccC
LPDDMAQQGAETVLRSIPPELRPALEPDQAARWLAHPLAVRSDCAEGVGMLLALPARTASLRLLADETAKVFAGMLHVLDALALLVDASSPSPQSNGGLRPGMPDWLPGLVNAGRAFVTIAAVELFWIVTAWPNGAAVMVVVAVLLLLLSPKGDLAFGGAIAATLGAAASIICAAIIKFAVLPAFETFPAFCIAIGLFLIPVGFALARSRQPAAIAVLTVMAFTFMPLLAPTNQMSYDIAQFYNSALAIFVGCGVAPLAFRLLPPLSPALRARRLLTLTMRDLRRLAIAPVLSRSEDWEGRVFGRLAALPDQAGSLQRARLLAALSVGREIIQLRRAAPDLGVAAELDAALAAFAQGHSAIAIARLRQLDRSLGDDTDADPEMATALRARSRILVISEALAEHASYFDAGTSA